MSKRRQRAGRQAVGVGVAATIAVIILYALGGLDWLEYKTLDLRFAYTNSIAESPDLICIDIDDAALDMVGRWPWPRDVQAALISVLREAGVRTLLIDLTLGDPEAVRTIVPRQVDMAFDLSKLSAADVVLAFPDYEIRDALADLGQAYLATHYSSPRWEHGLLHGKVWKDFLESDEFDALVRGLQRDSAAAEDAARRLVARMPRPGEPPWDPLLWARLVAALTDDPTLEEPALRERLGLPKQTAFAPALEDCRAAALRRRVRLWLDEQPARWDAHPYELLAELNTTVLGGAPRYSEALAVALRDVLSYQATVQSVAMPSEALAGAAPAVDAFAPVYYLQARAARRCGFVAFEPDSDGVMRRTRLLVQHRGRALPQLALAVAWDVLGLSTPDVRVQGEYLIRTISGRSKRLAQFDEDGRTLVPWVPQRDWTRQFGPHVPIGMVFQIFDRRQSLRHNNEQFVLGELGEVVAELGQAHYAEDLRARLDVEDKLRAARYRGDRKSAEFYAGLIPQYLPVLQEGILNLGAAVTQAVAAIETALREHADEALAARLARLRRLEQVLRANAEYQAEIEALLVRLNRCVGGKIGLIGYTATALADMTPIPTHERAPGVMAHANLLSGLLTGNMVRWAPTWLNVLLALVAGLVTTRLTSRLRPRSVVPASVGLVAACGALAAAAFYFGTYWLAVTPASGAVLASGLAVLLYRHMFLERESRQIATALSQYTSATLARQMAEDAELCKRAETREVTAMFTDLAGFTTMSERIGAERTQRLLNVSLGRFADVMLAHEGMVNKFIGDGIFAFWNPVILPQADHALRACETSVDLLRAVHELIAEQRACGGDEIFSELVLRVGVATGPAVVGPCGSEKKYDYTCIGDSVNVAARLESANKFYGTRSLVSGATRAAVGERFVFRSLGGVRVKGKTQIVPIFELLGRAGMVPESELRYAERFGRAIDLFQRRQWADAWEAFAACLRERSDDLAAQQYLDTVERYQFNPPDVDWSGALELTEK